MAVAVASCSASHTQESATQGWTEIQRSEWYEATQGSRLIPYDWLVALEQPGSDRPFLDDAHIVGFRYLPRTTSFDIRLPVGFALDQRDDRSLSRTQLRWKAGQRPDERWVGMNCSACHTAEITYAGQSLRIDGGPTLADFQGFVESLNLALTQTLAEPGKWDRFAAKILQAEDNSTNRTMLQEALGQLVSWQTTQSRMNQTPLRYGYGRLDAFGHIFNKVALVADSTNATPNPADAPVSYPFLWNIHQLGHVQYNAIVANSPLRSPISGGTFDVGALGRNTGEVIGVFADVAARRAPGLKGFDSSVDIGSLVALEQRLMRLEPPKWPTHFPPINEELAAEGERLFRANCASCHLPLTDLTTRVPDRISTFNGASAPDPTDPARDKPPGTDPWMACNAYTYRSASGTMEGLPAAYLSGPPLERVANLSDMLRTTVAGVLIGAKDEVIRSAFSTFLFGDRPPRVVTAPPPVAAAPPAVRVMDPRQARLNRCMQEHSVLLGYKARPLTGIWATAPYLHNGSVPNLYQLLLPPAERVVSFRIGTREFDPKHVGYVIDEVVPGNTQTFSTIDEHGQPTPGNSNAGHDYGNAKLDEAARLAIIEYMKRI
ncbi:c-type cytochrome [Teichococcus vastitatis]|uniref:Di-heme-cytochrome C peroxidase n=1 Tax=Teichococcus vastitatis TaxID=2307076 RepID=A0ABS9W4K6_9PROT|nr:cytochrome c [Pseudoroseomonas vastitatis]MCI0753549.1 di-heme-cytochrome C peroxidase [Pseudoroseomonas vastitatis]